MKSFNTQKSSRTKHFGSQTQQPQQKRLPLATRLLNIPKQQSINNQQVSKKGHQTLDNQWPHRKRLSLANRLLHKRRLRRLQPNPKLKERTSPNTGVKFYTPQELLELTPHQYRALMETVLTRLPEDYTIPDHTLTNIYHSLMQKGNNH